MQDQAVLYYAGILNRLSLGWPQVVEEPCGKNILVLSPHPDDDVFACGGTLMKHGSDDSEITSIYLTDGSKGGVVSGPDKDLVREREREARSAGELLGIKRQIFLRHVDQELRATDDTVAEVRQLFSEIRPDLVYVPFVIDGFYHRDHMETNRLLAGVAGGYQHTFKCCAYEVYSPLIPNTVVDITRQMDLKVTAMRIFQTQLAVKDYLGAIVSLNRFRGLTFSVAGSTKFMEAFFCIDSCAYCELLRLVLAWIRGGMNEDPDVCERR